MSGERKQRILHN